MKGRSQIGSLEIQRYVSFVAQSEDLQVSETHLVFIIIEIFKS